MHSHSIHPWLPRRCAPRVTYEEPWGRGAESHASLGPSLVDSPSNSLYNAGQQWGGELRGFFEDDKRLAPQTVRMNQFQDHGAARSLVQERIARAQHTFRRLP